ncbi:MAG: hypothetical protein H6736_13255 [Alphaproteobacteria bacterium]|nr:hypothetical protein [Alphaproteobacteria bacterium]
MDLHTDGSLLLIDGTGRGELAEVVLVRPDGERSIALEAQRTLVGGRVVAGFLPDGRIAALADGHLRVLERSGDVALEVPVGPDVHPLALHPHPDGRSVVLQSRQEAVLVSLGAVPPGELMGALPGWWPDTPLQVEWSPDPDAEPVPVVDASGAPVRGAWVAGQHADASGSVRLPGWKTRFSMGEVFVDGVPMAAIRVAGRIVVEPLPTVDLPEGADPASFGVVVGGRWAPIPLEHRIGSRRTVPERAVGATLWAADQPLVSDRPPSDARLWTREPGGAWRSQTTFLEVRTEGGDALPGIMIESGRKGSTVHGLSDVMGRIRVDPSTPFEVLDSPTLPRDPGANAWRTRSGTDGLVVSGVPESRPFRPVVAEPAGVWRRVGTVDTRILRVGAEMQPIVPGVFHWERLLLVVDQDHGASFLAVTEDGATWGASGLERYVPGKARRHRFVASDVFVPGVEVSAAYRGAHGDSDIDFRIRGTLSDRRVEVEMGDATVAAGLSAGMLEPIPGQSALERDLVRGPLQIAWLALGAGLDGFELEEGVPTRHQVVDIVVERSVVTYVGIVPCPDPADGRCQSIEEEFPDTGARLRWWVQLDTGRVLKTEQTGASGVSTVTLEWSGP